MARKTLAVVGAAETTRLGVIPDMSILGLQADAALNALADAGLALADIDGLACAEPPWTLAAYLGVTPKWVDSTYRGGCSFMVHVRHAAAAIAAGYCTTVLIVHGESGRSRVGMLPYPSSPSSLEGQFERPFGAWAATNMFTIPALRYMKTYGVTEEDLARIVVIQREWAAMNPRASLREPITVDEVLNAPTIAWPFRKPMCCLVTDGGGALIVTHAERARDFPHKPLCDRHGRKCRRAAHQHDGGLPQLARLSGFGRGGLLARPGSAVKMSITSWSTMPSPMCRYMGWRIWASARRARPRTSFANAALRPAASCG